MPGLPNRTQVHVDAPLTNFAISYVSQLGYVGNLIPTINIAKQSGKFFTYDKAYWFTDEAQMRGPGAESAGNGWKVSTTNYHAEVYGFHKDVDDQTARNADAPIDLYRDASRFVGQKMALKKERVFASEFIGQSVWGGSGAPGTTWDNAASTPIEDVRAQFTGVVEKTGFKPNTLIVGAEVHTDLVDHPDIIDRIKHTQRAVVSADTLAALFEVNRYIVCYATYNSSAEQATASYDFVGNSGKNALLCHLNPNAGLMSAPTALACFQWSSMGIERFRMPSLKSDRIEGEEAYDMVVTGSDLGYEFTSAVS